MTDSSIRLGFVSTYDPGTGMATIYYPDRTHQVTGELPVFSPFGLLQTLNKDDPVYVLHLPNATEEGLVIGGYSAEGGVPTAGIMEEGGSLVLYDPSGRSTLSGILSRLAEVERRLTEVEGKV